MFFGRPNFKTILLLLLSGYGLVALLFTVTRLFPSKELSSKSKTGDESGNRWNNIAVAVKTGELTASTRLPIQLMTFLKNVPNVLYFGDSDVKVGELKVIGVLKDLYQDGDYSVIPANAPPDQIEKGPKKHKKKKIVSPEGEGWAKDAHKNLPAFKTLYNKYPDKDWYIMIDDDTYVFYDALVNKLKKFDPNRPHYLGNFFEFAGCVTDKEKPYFAHGGSGIFISRGAMKKMIKIVDSCITKYRRCWAGDVRTALCLRDVGVFIDVDNAVGFFSEAPGLGNEWPDDACAQVVTLHHLTPLQMQQMYELEIWSAKTKKQLTAGKVLNGQVTEAILKNKDWEIDDYIESYDHFTAEKCRSKCRENEKCRIWVVDAHNICWLKNHISSSTNMQSSTAGIIPSHYTCKKSN
jgi:hypothetical protein